MNHPLTDVGHQVRRQVGSQPFEEIQGQDGHADLREVSLRSQDLVEDQLNEVAIPAVPAP